MTARQLLSVSDLNKRFVARDSWRPKDRRYVWAVNNVSLTLARGEALGIVGESGSGKSTVARLLLGLLSPTSGAIRLEETEITRRAAGGRGARRPQMQAIFQDPFSSLNPRMRIKDSIAEPLIIAGARRGEVRRAVDRMLELVGLSPTVRDRFPHEFSGGQRQRICIARALIVNPAILICDEAVSALDVSVKAQIINLLRSLRGELGLSYLFISHDLSIVYNLCDRVAVMYFGSVVEAGDRHDIFHSPQHPYTRALLSAVPQIEVGRRAERIRLAGELPSPLNPPNGCRFHPRCQFARTFAGRRRRHVSSPAAGK